MNTLNYKRNNNIYNTHYYIKKNDIALGVDISKSNIEMDIVVCSPNIKLDMDASNHIYFNGYVVNKDKPIAQEFTISCKYAIASNNYSLSVTIFKYFSTFF
jgi:hypothetical protein